MSDFRKQLVEEFKRKRELNQQPIKTLYAILKVKRS